MSGILSDQGSIQSGPFQELVQNTFTRAGIQINGSENSDPQVHNADFYQQLIRGGDLALGETYVDGWWDCDALDEFISRLISHRRRQYKRADFLKDCLYRLKGWVLPDGSVSNAYKIAKEHYDLGNSLYSAILDKRMTYSCGFWGKGADNLDQAQEDKLDLICQKLKLEPGMTVLDCGCGWGSFAAFSAENYNVEVAAVNVSIEQVTYAKQRYSHLPISFHLADYRQHKGCYDRIVSIGMIEHVGSKYYRTYIEKMRACLKDDGLMLLQSIGNNHSKFRQDWMTKYIFPGGFVPSLAHLSAAVENLFVIEDVQNLSVNYDRTLMEWSKNFEAHWHKISKEYNKRFYRMWRFYLLSCAGLFRARELQLYQLLLSPYGLKSGYQR